MNNLAILRSVVGGLNTGGIQLIAHEVEMTGVTVVAAYRLEADGHALGAGFGSLVVTPTFSAGEWHEDEPGTTGADFEVRAEQVSGDAMSGDALDTWHRLNVERNFNMLNADAGTTKTGTFTLRFRNFGGSIILKSIPGNIVTAIRTV